MEHSIPSSMCRRVMIFLTFTKILFIPANPLIFTVASEQTDGYLRFIRSAEQYKLSVSLNFSFYYWFPGVFVSVRVSLGAGSGSGMNRSSMQSECLESNELSFEKPFGGLVNGISCVMQPDSRIALSLRV